MTLYQSRNLACYQVIPGIHPDMVACVLQLAENAALPIPQKIAYGSVAAGVGVFAGGKAASAGYTDRILTEGIGEGDCLSLLKKSKKGVGDTGLPRCPRLSERI